AKDGEATLVAPLGAIGSEGGEHAAAALEQSTKAELFGRLTLVAAALAKAKDQIWTRLASRGLPPDAPDGGAAGPTPVAPELAVSSPRSQRFDVESYVHKILAGAGATVVAGAKDPISAIVRVEYTEAEEEKYRDDVWGTRVGLRVWVYDLRRRRV